MQGLTFQVFRAFEALGLLVRGLTACMVEGIATPPTRNKAKDAS